MTEGHWAVMLLTGAVMAALTAFSLYARPGSRGSRAARRVFWAAAPLMLMGPALTPLTFVLTAFFGVPGWGAAWALATMAGG